MQGFISVQGFKKVQGFIRVQGFMTLSIFNSLRVSFLFLCIITESVAAPVAYADLALGVGVHVLEESDQGATSKLIKAGVGVQWLSFLSTQLGVWSWNSEEQEKEKERTLEDAERDRTGVFDGLSGSLEVALQWPIDSTSTQLSVGPYYRYGRHCWSAVLTGLLQPWSKEGCSELNTLGFSFPMAREQNAGVYLEFTQTDFDDLSSNSLQFGAKLAF